MLNGILVYGTLQSGGSYHHLVVPYVYTATAPGFFVDLGTCPGWVEGAEIVHGQVLPVHTPEAVPQILDDLEGYQGPGHPANPYQRLVSPVWAPSGQSVAWAYRYRGTAAGTAVLPGGCWPPTP